MFGSELFFFQMYFSNPDGLLLLFPLCQAEALLHGHSYTAYPLGCMAATASLHILQNPALNPNYCAPGPSGGSCPATPACSTSCQKLKSQWSQEGVIKLSHHPGVQGVVSVGSVLAMELKGGGGGYLGQEAGRVLSALRCRGLACRPLGGVVYVMVTPTTSVGKCEELMGAVVEALDEVAGAEVL